MKHRSIQILMGSVMVIMLTSCAVFQSKPELKSVTSMDLFEWIDAKATTAEMQARDSKVTTDRLLQVFTATKVELQRRVNDGEITDIEVFNRLGFGLTARTVNDELPSALPDSTKDRSNL